MMLTLVLIMCQHGELDTFIRRHLHGGLSENRLTGAHTGEWNFSAEMRLEKEIASLCTTHCCATFRTIYCWFLLWGLLKHSGVRRCGWRQGQEGIEYSVELWKRNYLICKTQMVHSYESCLLLSDGLFVWKPSFESPLWYISTFSGNFRGNIHSIMDYRKKNFVRELRAASLLWYHDGFHYHHHGMLCGTLSRKLRRRVFGF